MLHARRSHAAFHRHFLCPGVSLRQGVRKVEVAHALTIALLFPEKF
jgi:hypothetical protein